MFKALAEAPSTHLLADPLEYILADHFRQRTLCAVFEDFASDGRVDPEMGGAALAFLSRDFGLHVLDEEEDLIPLLRRRSLPDDNVNEVLGKLSKEHSAERPDAEAISQLLRNPAGVDSGWPERLRRFASNERLHLVVENAIVLPLAKARLTESDLRSFGRRMAARRGLQFPGKSNDR